MTKGILLILCLASAASHSMDYLKPMYNPEKGAFLGRAVLAMDSSEWNLKDEDNNSEQDYKTQTQSFVQFAEAGVSESIVALASVNYVISQTREIEGTEEESAGLEGIRLGARYRLSNDVELPLPVDVGAIFKPSLKNRQEANANDEGSSNSGGHELGFFARTGGDKWYFSANMDLHLEQTAENPTDDEVLYTVDPYVDLDFILGFQFKLMNLVLMDVSGLISRAGERTLNFEAGGDSVYKSRFDVGVNVQAYYEVIENVSANAGITYVTGQDQDLEASNDYTIKNTSFTGYNIGAVFLF